MRPDARPLALALALSFSLGLAATAVGQVPGPEIFDREPTTPYELWEAADYLVRTDQAAKAVPYLQRFMDAAPDDADLIRIRDKFGFGSALRLQDQPATARFAEPATRKIIEAARRFETDPARVAGFVELLTKSPLEQRLAVQGLRSAGPAGVPLVLKALQDPALDGAGRAAIVANLGRLGAPAVPPLLATLESPDGPLAAAAAAALAHIGDRRALPFLTAAAVARPGDSDADAAARSAAARAVDHLNGRPVGPDLKTKAIAGYLAGEARRFQAHEVQFPGDPVTVWAWDADASAPAPRTLTVADAEAELGRKLASAALVADPSDPSARALLVGLDLERAIARAGFDKFPGDDRKALDAAAAAGPDVLARVLRRAVADGEDDLGAVVAGLLAAGLTPEALAAARPTHPLVDALDAAGRRTRFAAAKALAAARPGRAFPGSSRVVPILAHALAARPTPKAVVIDGNLSRGNNVAGHLRALGYDSASAATGDEGFRLAAASADVEIILVDQQLLMSDWKLQDTLANLGADARTAGVPVYLYGPLKLEYDLPTLQERFPKVRRIVTPVNPQILDEQLAIVGRPTPLSAAEKGAHAREAAALLARIAADKANPYASDLTAVEPEVAGAIRGEATGPAALEALAATPALDAQRTLADALADPSAPAARRASAGAQLVRSLDAYGALLTSAQESRLAEAYAGEADPAVRDALARALNALRRRGPVDDTLRPGPAPAPRAAG